MYIALESARECVICSVGMKNIPFLILEHDCNRPDSNSESLMELLEEK